MASPGQSPLDSLSLDHCGAIVRDLAAGAARWEKLGFALSPVSRQRGKMPGRDEESAWATANRCAIFQSGYLELIGVVDAGSFNPWSGFLDRFEGLHLLALRVPNADAAYAALVKRAASLNETLNPPVQRARKLDVDGVERTMGFRNIFSKDAHYPEGRYIVLEHQTPEYLWQPRYQTHPNGALALEAAMICAEDLRTQRERLGALFGEAGSEDQDGVVHFSPPGGGAIQLHAAADFRARYGWTPPALPAFAGVRVRFASRTEAARHIEHNAIAVQRQGADWFVAPAHANGFVLRISE